MIICENYNKRLLSRIHGGNWISQKDKGGTALPPFGNQAIKIEAPIPITVALSYNTYESLLLQELLESYLKDKICPNYPHDDPPPGPPIALKITNTTVDRTAIFIEEDAYGTDTTVERQVEIVLAKCPICKGRFRVLPADILPYKHYTLPAIECGVRLYNQGDLSLREVAWDKYYGERTPVHATIHGWTEGLGAYWSGRGFGEVAYAQPASRIMADLELRFSQAGSLHSIPVSVNPIRYRSQGRLERLEACQRFEATCAMAGAHNFFELNRLIVGWGNSFGFCFRSAIRNTGFEHMNSKDVIPLAQTSGKERMTCPIRGRSPPGDSK